MERLTNATISLETCRTLLDQYGQKRAASALRGLEVMDPGSARMAHGILSAVPVYGSVASVAKSDALNALELAASDTSIGQA